MATKKTKDPLAGLIGPILQSLTPQRLERALEALILDTYKVTSEQRENAITGTVQNGTGAAYECLISEKVTRCNCKDRIYRGVICKHLGVLALSLTRPQVKKTSKKPRRRHLHLAWSRPDGFSDSNSNSQNAGWGAAMKSTIQDVADSLSWAIGFTCVQDGGSWWAGAGEEVGPTGAFLGVVELVDVRMLENGAFAWVLSNPRTFNCAIPGKGQLNLFDLPSQVIKTLARVTRKSPRR